MLKKILKLGRQRLWLIHREYLREKHELKYLFWECTLNCNCHCKHCGSHAGEKVLQDVVSTEEIKKAFYDISKNFNAKEITIAITGGEPLLRKDLFEVMKYASSLGFNWGMVTNGLLVTADIVKKSKDAGMKTVDISIDGFEDVHDEFRNMPGSYKKAINAVKEASKVLSETFRKVYEPDTEVEVEETDSKISDEVLKLTVPAHNPIKRSTLAHILKQARISLEELDKFL